MPAPAAARWPRCRSRRSCCIEAAGCSLFKKKVASAPDGQAQAAIKIEVTPYRAPAWLPGGQLQTLWPALHARRVAGPRIAYRRERWDTPDGDFVDVDWLEPAAPAGAPLLVLFHGLEGSSRSHYAEAFAGWARSHGVGLAVPHFRG